MSLVNSSNDSSAEEGENEFTPTQANFPKLSPDEEMRILEARIMELKIRKAMAQSSRSSDAYDQNENVAKRNDNGSSSNNSLDNGGQQLLKRMNVLEEKQRQNEAETKAMFEQQIEQLQNVQKTSLDRIGEWEKKQEEKWTKALADQMEAFLDKLEKKQQQKFDNEQKTLLNKISELEKQQQMLSQQSEMDSVVKSNFWDANFCHNSIAISGPNCTVVEGIGWHSVFAKYFILDSAVGPSNIFYYELSVKNMRCGIFFGFAVKHQTPLDEGIGGRAGTYAYKFNGNFWIDESEKDGNETFDVGDTVGCGVNLANKQLFFTKNGHRIDVPDNFCICSSLSADSLFPFVSLYYLNDKIMANFGPEFMFDLSTLV